MHNRRDWLKQAALLTLGAAASHTTQVIAAPAITVPKAAKELARTGAFELEPTEFTAAETYVPEVFRYEEFLSGEWGLSQELDQPPECVIMCSFLPIPFTAAVIKLNYAQPLYPLWDGPQRSFYAGRGQGMIQLLGLQRLDGEPFRDTWQFESRTLNRHQLTMTLPKQRLCYALSDAHVVACNDSSHRRDLMLEFCSLSLDSVQGSNHDAPSQVG